MACKEIPGVVEARIVSGVKRAVTRCRFVPDPEMPVQTKACVGG
jgi:hypothetical protein